MSRWVLLTWALVVHVWPTRVFAHEGLQRSVPAKDAHLSAAPRSLRLTFTSAPQRRFVRVRLFGPGNTPVALSALRLDSARTVVADIASPLAAGVYAVDWQIIGADGHSVRGQFNFTIVPGASGLGVSHEGHAPDTPVTSLPSRDSAHDPVAMPTGAGFDAESPGYVAIRWATFSSVLAILGVLAFQFAVLPLASRHGPRNRFEAVKSGAVGDAARLGVITSVALLLATILRLVVQSLALHGRQDVFDPNALRGMLFETGWGRAWITQLATTMVALAAFLRARRAGKTAWAVAAIATVGVAFTLPFSGHAAAVPELRPAAIAADGFHVLGAGGWIGGLFALLAIGVPTVRRLDESERANAVAHLVNAFSPTALAFAAVTAITGTFSAWLHLGNLSALWSSSYGRTLLLKLALLSILAVTAAYNWRRVRPSLGSDESTSRLRKSGWTELAVSIVVIAITAVLVATPPPREMPAPHTMESH